MQHCDSMGNEPDSVTSSGSRLTPCYCELKIIQLDSLEVSLRPRNTIFALQSSGDSIT